MDTLPSRLPPNEDRGPIILKLTLIMNATAFIFILLRLYTRFFVKKSSGWDDYLITLGFVSTASTNHHTFGQIGKSLTKRLLKISGTIGSAFSCLQVQNGFGRHIQYLSRPEIVRLGKWTLSNELGITFTLVKISGCIFILRMTHNVQKRVRYIIYLLSTLLSVISLASIFVLGLQCFPLKRFYDKSIKGTCISSEIPQRVFQTYSSKLKRKLVYTRLS